MRRSCTGSSGSTRWQRLLGALPLALLWGADLAWAADPVLNPTPSLDGCVCQRAENGLCRRWGRWDLSWQLFAPHEEPSSPANADIERAIIAAMAQWQAVSCGVCTVSGNLPAPPAAGSAAAGSGGVGCVATSCDSNPLGLQLNYGGISNTAALASACGSASNPALCDGSAANSAQIAYLRNDDLWHGSKFQVTASFVTSARNGTIIDADILLRDTTHVFCLSQCRSDQYDVRSALSYELGHAIGLGAQTEAAMIAPDGKQTGALLPSMIPPETARCACLAYRFSTDPEMCLPPPRGYDCNAGPLLPLPSAQSQWPTVLAVGVCALALLLRLWRGRRQTMGVNSPPPQRRM